MKKIEMDLIEDQLFIFSDVSGYMTPSEDVDTVRTGAGGTHGHMDTMTTSMCPQIVQSYKDNNGHVVPGHRHQSHFEYFFICL